MISNKPKLHFCSNLLISGILLASSALLSPGRAAEIVVTESLSEDTTWVEGNTYVLNGRIFVLPGTKLTVEAGTVIKGKPGEQEKASVLVVSPGAQIFAEGTAEKPIIFTTEEDDLSQPYDMGPGDWGKWGGLIILGRARLNSPEDSGSPITDNIEGLPATDERGKFGGDDDEDNSGVLRYVSIRHGGAKIADDNEINGLTLGGVGRGTRIEYVEVFANLDDGIEFFGGTVEVKHAVVAYCGDDSYDYDQGYRGKGQFWFSIASRGDRGGEHDGDVDNLDALPLSQPTIYNATYIGNGGEGEQDALKLRENAGGHYANSIFTEFEDQALDISDDAEDNMAARIAAGDLEIRNSLFWGFGSDKENASTDTAQVFFTDASYGNRYGVDPQLRRINRAPSLEELEEEDLTDPRPMEGSPALEGGLAEPADGFFHDVDFVGAFGAVNWASGWTVISQNGLLSNAGAGTPNYPLAGSEAIVLSIAVNADGDIEVSFMTVAGGSYQVQVSTNLLADWHNYGDPIAGDGTVAKITFNLEELAQVSPEARGVGFARVISQ